MKINYTDTTEMNSLLLETENHIRTLERSLDSLNAKIAAGEEVSAASLDRLVRIIDGNREERDHLMDEIELAANNNINAAQRHSQLPANFWPTNLVD